MRKEIRMRMRFRNIFKRIISRLFSWRFIESLYLNKKAIRDRAYRNQQDLLRAQAEKEAREFVSKQPEGYMERIIKESWTSPVVLGNCDGPMPGRILYKKNGIYSVTDLTYCKSLKEYESYQKSLKKYEKRNNTKARRKSSKNNKD